MAVLLAFDHEDDSRHDASSGCKSAPFVLGGDGNAEATDTKSLKSLIQSVKNEAERKAIAAALDKTRWNRKAAARMLKVSYRTLLYQIDQHHMRAPDPYF